MYTIMSFQTYYIQSGFLYYIKSALYEYQQVGSVTL